MYDAPEVVTLYEPATAAEKLGVSASGLRRLAPIYEAVHDELPRSGKGREDKRARLWPHEAVERLRTARALLEAGRYTTIQAALEALRDGKVSNTDELTLEASQRGADVATQQALQVLLDEMRALRGEVAELRTIRGLLERLEATTQANQLVEPETAARVKQLDKAEVVARETAETSEHGLIVRVALWLEARLRG